MVASIAYRSLPYEDALLVTYGCLFKVSSCKEEAFAFILERLSQNIVGVMREMSVDITEVALVKAIFLFDPGCIFV
jgi:hypothetical protein